MVNGEASTLERLVDAFGAAAWRRGALDVVADLEEAAESVVAADIALSRARAEPLSHVGSDRDACYRLGVAIEAEAHQR